MIQIAKWSVPRIYPESLGEAEPIFHQTRIIVVFFGLLYFSSPHVLYELSFLDIFIREHAFAVQFAGEYAYLLHSGLSVFFDYSH